MKLLILRTIILLLGMACLVFGMNLYANNHPSDGLQKVILLLSIGAILLLLALSMFVFDYHSKKVDRYIRRFGVRVTARVINIKLEKEVAKKGVHPYRIEAKWEDSVTGKNYIFSSQLIWLNPKKFLMKNLVSVLVDKRNLNHYIMDTSFLPKKKPKD